MDAVIDLKSNIYEIKYAQIIYIPTLEDDIPN